jgi:hypothetical protein
VQQDPLQEALAVSLALRRLLPKGRASDLDEVAKDILSLIRVGDHCKDSHF